MRAKDLVKETVDYSRKGIKHIYMPNSTSELRDSEFLKLVDELHTNGGTLDTVSISLKVDGAGIRFGKDEHGVPFFMTSRVTKPFYAKNVGDFERYGKSVNQSDEQLERTCNYDRILDTIVNSDSIQKLPKDCIIQAEILYTPMARKTNAGLKFVNLSYDPNKLGTVMTIVPISINRYSTGKPLPDREEIKQLLLFNSNPDIKFVDSNLPHDGIDVSEIIAPVVNMDKELRDSLAKRKSPLKEQAKAILSQVRQRLSTAIINHPNISNKDVLGNTVEGIVLAMPSGLRAKITTPIMQSAMATKLARPSNRVKPAVVTVGSFVGHIGHQHLVNQVIKTAQEVGGDPYVYISPRVGPDDPIPADVKLATWSKLFPEHAGMFQLITAPDGSASTPIKKIEKELVIPENSPYNKIILIVGEDRAEGFKKWLSTLEKRMKDPSAIARFGGTADQVEYEVISIPRSDINGGNAMRFTDLRNVLKDPNATDTTKLNTWAQGFDIEKLGLGWIENLMIITKNGIG